MLILDTSTQRRNRSRRCAHENYTHKMIADFRMPISDFYSVRRLRAKTEWHKPNWHLEIGNRKSITQPFPLQRDELWWRQLSRPIPLLVRTARDNRGRPLWNPCLTC